MKNIIDAIQPLLALNVITQDGGEDVLITRDDQLYLYEVIGVLIVSGETENQVSFYTVSRVTWQIMHHFINFPLNFHRKRLL